ncbi:MAG: hypothetical protein J6Z11_08950 [Candidatus Riflebacteria bacterium]|nr:hypothetical protein [Candidatus Riflebacteria bacterium]
MSKDFNSDMFSAILASNEKTTAMLATQLEAAQKQAKWNEIKFYVTIGVFATLFAALLWLHFNKKVETPTVNVNYEQDATNNSESLIKNGDN